MHPGAQLVDHLLVELADAPARRPGLAHEEDAEQAAIRDRAAARHRHDAGVAPALDDVRHPVPDDPRLELGELVGRVARRRASRGRPRAPRASASRTARPGARSRAARRRSTVHDGHRDDLLGEDVERVARQDVVSIAPVVHAPRRRPRTRAGRRGTSGRSRPCEARRPGGRRGRPAGARARRSSALDLDDEVDGAHVDAELEARRRDERGSRPALSPSSISRRCSRAIEPWCARTSSSPASSLSRWASRSARRRLLTKMIVLRCARMSSRIRGWIAGQMLVRFSPPDRAAGLLLERQDLAEPGHVLDRHDDLELERLARAGVDDLDLAARRRSPPRNRAIVSSGRWVADRPIRWSGRRPSAAPEALQPLEASARDGRRASSPAIAWTSSTMTVLDAAEDLARRAVSSR